MEAIEILSKYGKSYFSPEHLNDLAEVWKPISLMLRDGICPPDEVRYWLCYMANKYEGVYATLDRMVVELLDRLFEEYYGDYHNTSEQEAYEDEMVAMADYYECC